MNIKVERVQPPPPPKPAIHSVVVTLSEYEARAILNALNDTKISSYWIQLLSFQSSLRDSLNEG